MPRTPPWRVRPLRRAPYRKKRGEGFLLKVGAFWLTVELLCLQSVKILIRHIFPL